MKSIYTLWRQMKSAIAAGAEYVHVCEATQLEVHIFERFSWASSVMVAACAYQQKGENWAESFSSAQVALLNARSPHLLSSYEANLERAYTGPPPPETLACEIVENFRALQSKLSKVKLPEAATIVPRPAALLAQSGLSSEWLGAVRKELSTTCNLCSPGLVVANLVTSVLSTAGTWYGLWCVKRKLDELGHRQEVGSTQLKELAEQLDSLPESIMERIQLLRILERIRKLKDIVKLLEEEADLHEADPRRTLDQCKLFIADARRTAQSLLSLIQPDECSRQVAAPLAWHVLEAICLVYDMELQVYRSREAHLLPQRAQQIRENLEGPVLDLAWNYLRCEELIQDCMKTKPLEFKAYGPTAS